MFASLNNSYPTIVKFPPTNKGSPYNLPQNAEDGGLCFRPTTTLGSLPQEAQENIFTFLSEETIGYLSEPTLYNNTKQDLSYMFKTKSAPDLQQVHCTYNQNSIIGSFKYIPITITPYDPKKNSKDVNLCFRILPLKNLPKAVQQNIFTFLSSETIDYLKNSGRFTFLSIPAFHSFPKGLINLTPNVREMERWSYDQIDSILGYRTAWIEKGKPIFSLNDLKISFPKLDPELFLKLCIPVEKPKIEKPKKCLIM